MPTIPDRLDTAPPRAVMLRREPLPHSTYPGLFIALWRARNGKAHYVCVEGPHQRRESRKFASRTKAQQEWNRIVRIYEENRI